MSVTVPPVTSKFMIDRFSGGMALKHTTRSVQQGGMHHAES